jgi:hypothetical protein
MITVRVPQDKEFDYEACRGLYDDLNDRIQDGDFDDVINRTQFFSFYIASTNELIGCIYYYEKDNKLFVNAFANRKHHRLNLECLKETFKWFDGDIYATTKHKTAILCLYRCGFKKINDNTFVYRR